MVPGATDSATINGFIVLLDVDAEVKQLNILGTTVAINGSKNILVNDDFLWADGGDIGNASGGTITVSGKAKFTGGGSKDLSGKEILLNGGGTWLDGRMDLTNNSKLELAADHTLHFMSDNLISVRTFHNSRFINNGTIKRSSASNKFLDFASGFENHDSVIIESGVIRFFGAISDPGVIVINAPGLLFLSSCDFTHTEFIGGRIIVQGGFNEINVGTTIDSRLDIVSGTLKNNIDLILNQPFLLYSSGGFGSYVGGDGSHLTLNAKSHFSGFSFIKGAGSIEANDTFSFFGNDKRMEGDVSLTLNDVSIWSEGNIILEKNTQIVNEGVLHIETTVNKLVDRAGPFGSHAIINNGTIIKSDLSETEIEVHFQNNGMVLGIGTFNFANTTVSGSGTFGPGFSPGIITVDGDLNLDAGFLIEIEDETGEGIGHDLVKVAGQIDISDAFCQLTGAMNITDGTYKILECTNGPGCYTGTFDTTYLPSDLRLDFRADRINVVKGPACINTWKVDGLFLSNDPHISLFQTANKIISNGMITSMEDITFDAPQGAELIEGFEITANANFAVTLVGCEE